MLTPLHRFFVEGENVSVRPVYLDFNVTNWVYNTGLISFDGEIEPDSTALLWGPAGGDFEIIRSGD